MVTLIQNKAANPQMPLTLEGSLAVFKYCFEQGRADAQRALGRTVILVVGTTGVGKSTFLNFLAGCTMVSKTKKSLGMKGVGNVVVVKPVSEGGRRDELVKIVHGHVSLSVLPNVTVDQETDGPRERAKRRSLSWSTTGLLVLTAAEPYRNSSPSAPSHLALWTSSSSIWRAS